jgi:4-amino-4-deoxy-L-arabinose transferase-like glycosyltransferase
MKETWRGRAKTKVPLLFLFGIATAFRLAWMWTQVAAIENEGAEYCRLAENLINGKSYLGVVANEGLQLNFPPLYPLLIGLLSFPLRDFEAAGRVVSLLAGVGLVWAVYLVCRSIYGPRVAFIGASVVATHPVLVGFSASVYSEGPYITLMVFAIYWALRTAKHRSISAGSIAGALFGLAYLTRPEALFLSLVLLVPLFVLGFVWRDPRGAAASSAGLVLALMIVASPYVAFLSINAGHLRWEGKGAIIYAIGERISSGMTYLEASYGIDQDLREVGIHLKSNREVVQSGAMRIRDWDSLSRVARYFAASARRNLADLYRVVADDRAFGSPILFILALLGLFRSPWSKERTTCEAILLVLFCASLMVLLVGQGHDFRHTLLLLPILIIWAAKGIDEFGEWAKGTASALVPRYSHRLGVGCRCLIILALWGVALRNVGTVGEFVQSKWAHLKTAGLWLQRHEPGPKNILGTRTAVPYYARGDLWYLPYAQSSLALRYIEKKNPDFIVLQSPGRRPFEESWMRDGIPGTKAKLIYSGGSEREGRVMIYEWLDRSSRRPLFTR